MEEEKKNNEKKVAEEDIWRDNDLAPLLFASEVSRENDTVDASEAEDDEWILEVPEIQDPDKANLLYHQTLQSLLRQRLAGATKEARKLIREQVNLLLKDGHKRHRDGKQAYFYRFEQSIKIIERWDELCVTDKIPISESKYLRLYCMFKDEVDKVIKQLGLDSKGK